MSDRLEAIKGGPANYDDLYWLIGEVARLRVAESILRKMVRTRRV